MHMQIIFLRLAKWSIKCSTTRDSLSTTNAPAICRFRWLACAVTAFYETHNKPTLKWGTFIRRRFSNSTEFLFSAHTPFCARNTSENTFYLWTLQAGCTVFWIIFYLPKEILWGKVYDRICQGGSEGRAGEGRGSPREDFFMSFYVVSMHL